MSMRIRSFQQLYYSSIFALVGVPNAVTAFGCTFLVIGFCAQQLLALMILMSGRVPSVEAM
jgi:hypothetical protein